MSLLPISYFDAALQAASQYLATFNFPSASSRKLQTAGYVGKFDSQAVQSIADCTFYLTWPRIYSGVRQQVTDFQPTSKFWIYVPADKISSELVMLAATWDLWKSKLPEGFIFGVPKMQTLHEYQNETMHVVFLDDWSLTGINQTGIIDDLQFDNPNIKFDFTVLTPFITERAVYQIHDINEHVKFTGTVVDIPQKHIAEETYFNEGFGNEVGECDFFCVYSDIKIADMCCCPRNLYLQTVQPQPFNIKKELEQFFPNLASSSM